MQIGVTFPTSEFGTDIGAVREWTQTVERMGFSFILTYDHVIGANRASRPGWRGYHMETEFHEPFGLFAFMAALTTRIGFATGVLILPQRQTVLVAKQAAYVDLLCNGRLRLGVGTGWNAVEYEALNVPYTERGKILDDQIGVLRALWTERAVTLKTAYHTITDTGINPMPVQQPIPLWFGGGGTQPVHGTPHVEKVVRRAARLGDGFMPSLAPNAEGADIIGRFWDYVREYGRDPAKVGLEGTVHLLKKTEASWADDATAWRKLGATHITLNTQADRLRGCEQHLKRLEEGFKAVRERLAA